jgi:phosphoribosyl-ATP pyrophosphohydrolase
MTQFSTEDLARIVKQRAASADEGSYTKQLVGKGVAACAQKLGEEAVEAAIAAVERDNLSLTQEAADVLYHLIVLLEASGVDFADVLGELERRTGQSGLQEKASRSR